jgi:hypothetical protein
MLKRGLIFFGLFFLTLSCDSLIDNPKSSVDHLSLYPLAVGNYWVYGGYRVEFNDTSVLKTTTLSVVDTTIIDGKVFKVLYLSEENFFRIYVHYYFSKNDSIFERASNFGHSFLELKYIRPKDRPTVFDDHIGGDYGVVVTATKKDTTITTPAGSFTGCYFYDWILMETKSREIIAPGVGLIKREYFAYNNMNQDSLIYKQISELQSYRAVDENTEGDTP